MMVFLLLGNGMKKIASFSLARRKTPLSSPIKKSPPLAYQVVDFIVSYSNTPLCYYHLKNERIIMVAKRDVKNFIRGTVVQGNWLETAFQRRKWDGRGFHAHGILE
ncbi:MAG: hypothetical protein JW821_10230 [Deltaproteobacteria bacterium]|nr:hypothetical protein [Deltaproteobacteria bacterium]